VDLDGSLAEALDRLEDLVGGFGPFEGLAGFVVRLDVGEDGLAESGNAGVRAPLEGVLGEQSEEALDEVEPWK